MAQSLTEQYRPQKFEDVVGQDDILKKIAVVKRRGLGGRAFLLTGKSGQGKTTIAQLIADDVSSDWQELDAKSLDTEKLRKIEDNYQQRCIFGDKTGHALIINEIHGLRASVITQLLVTLERIPDHVTIIFTTLADNLDKLEKLAGHDAKAFLSRLMHLKLSQKNLKTAFALRAFEIAQAEDLQGQPIEKFERFLSDNQNNFRKILQHIELGEFC